MESCTIFESELAAIFTFVSFAIDQIAFNPVNGFSVPENHNFDTKMI